MKQDKANITVDIKGVKKDDAGFYELITNGGKSFGELIVTPKPPVFNAAFTGKPTFYTATSNILTLKLTNTTEAKKIQISASVSRTEQFSHVKSPMLLSLVYGSETTRKSMNLTISSLFLKETNVN